MNKQEGHTIFITGAAGYVGGMLADQFSKRPDVREIIALDKESEPELLKGNKKILWITGNTSDELWREMARMKNPGVVINCAWQIREMYGKKPLQWKWNVEGASNVFDFAFSTPSVRRLIHFSTASSYGAYPGNTLEHRFKEEEPLRDELYLYAIEKKAVEERLNARYAEMKRRASAGDTSVNIPQVSVVRPAAITGPRGRYMFKRFGLMATLRNRLPDSPLYKLISLMVNRIPVASPTWSRQLIHEDDVTDIVGILAFKGAPHEFNVYNLAPPGAPVLAKDMAEIVRKKTFRIPPLMVRIAFFFFWHLTRGKVATSQGGWRFYTYPIIMDGTKVTRELAFHYGYESRPALENIAGRYASFVPPEER
jgi:nucleoside-diphosphate-sugar epimerase